MRLFSTAVPGFWAMLEDAPRGLLPSLQELALIDVSLNERKAYYLYNILIKLVELKIPLETIDLRACIASNRLCCVTLPAF